MNGAPLLGLFDGYMSLERDSLTSETKLGGTPTYLPSLTAEQLDTVDDWTRCGVCGRKMFLLLQAYSPLPEASKERPHHRMLYVFCCNSASCAMQPSNSWVAFTVQTEQEDEGALEEESDEEDTALETDVLTPAELPPHTLPPCFIYIDDEPAKEIVVPTDIEKELIRMAEENAKNSTLSDTDIAQLEANVDLKDKRVDYYYEKFRSRIARAPTQVIRYYQRSPYIATAQAETTAAEEEASARMRRKAHRPVFINPDKVKRYHSISACPTCGAALTHELQVMPTSLYYLRVGRYVAAAREAAATTSTSAPNADDGVDFGTVTVYTCSRGCAAASSGVHLRRELLCVEQQPTLKDDRADAEDGRKDLRQMIEHVDEEDEEEDDEDEGDVAFAAAAADTTAKDPADP